MPPKPLARALSQFGIEALRPGQREVIESVLGGRDTLAVMPSGAGKSLCYQVPSYCLPGTTVVVSPLIALMKDQAEKLEQHGVDAAPMSSALSAREESRLEERIAQRAAEIVYTTPERLGNEEFIRLLRRNPIDLFVVDEAHCISQWGHDFRPAYLEIAPALRALGNPPLLALTATATPQVIEDIRRHLERPALRVINTGVYREELFYAVRQVTSAAEHRQALAEALREARGTAIVYCTTVKAATAVHASLVAAGEPAELYHGQLGAAQREERQDRFMSGARVMVATNAFGMGIDKPDIRLVVHYQVPGSLEAYYQESGRAGRDGDKACALLLYNHADRRIQQFFAGGNHPGASDLARIMDAARLAAPHSRFTLRMLYDAGLDLPQTAARIGLTMLKEAGVVRAHTGGRYQLEAGEAPQIEETVAAFSARAQDDRDKLEQMVAYAHSATCRWRAIVEYFREASPWEKCGHCDNCVQPAAPALPPPAVRVRTVPKPPALAAGDRVVLPRYGKGKVRAASAERVSVDFPDGSTRDFLPRRVRRAAE